LLVINLVSLLTNRWNKSKVFIYNKNWHLANQSFNYFRYTEGFTTLDFNSPNSVLSSTLKKPTDEPSVNFGGSIQTVLYIFLKIIGDFFSTLFSAIPYGVFRVKSDNVSLNNTPINLQSSQNFFNVLAKVGGVRDFTISSNNITSTISHKNVNLYWYKKFLFFKKTKLFSSYLFKFSDFLYLRVFSKTFSKSLRVMNNFRVNNLVKQTSWQFYNSDKYTNFKVHGFFNFYLVGLRFFWLGLRFWVVGIVVALTAFFFFMQLKGLLFNRTVYGYFIVGMFFYWLISGFVFFIKKYQYSKFTTVIQRFWKRTFIIFWMIEGSLFVCFFYLVLNAPEEPLYMYDQIKIYKTHFFSWRWFLVKLIPSVLLILLGFYLQMLVRWGLFTRQSPILMIITLIIVYIFWVEFYQFLHVVSYYGNFFWVYDYDEFIWSLELDDRRNRIVNNSVAISLIAKFWHIVFMFIFWVFFILRVNEIGRIRYALIAANNQNFVLLYIISWVYMYPWFKYLMRKQLDVSYYWFNMHFRKSSIRVFFIDLKLHLFALIDRLSNPLATFESFQYNSFFYWNEFNSLTAASSARKASISNNLINSINSIL